jgi:hypothetical protein
MQRIILLALFQFLLLTESAYCQSISIDYLRKSRWKLVSPDFSYYKEVSVEFTDVSILWSSYFIKQDKKITWKYMYYVSNEVPKTFCKDKIERHKEGKYIVFSHGTDKSMVWYRIDNVKDSAFSVTTHLGDRFVFRRIDKELHR